MAFDTATRNELQKMVGRARDLLVEEFTAQCQGVYGIQPDGSMLKPEALGHLSEEDRTRAQLLRDRVQHLAAGIAGTKKHAEAVARMVREQAFTVLNRLCALRMCEERGLVQECVRSSYDSKGFRLYDQAANKLGGETYQRYRLFLELLFDELAVDLGVLFDRYSPYGLLLPRENAFKGLLELIDAPNLTHLWAEDETIGWIYQYFNPKEERKKMRDESAAPRNSRELAVRNQFFTPRYVVEFLTDNTLGRIWYEMTRGQTRLKDQCRYLVRRPNEIFLQPGEAAPEQSQQDNLSQEQLLQQPVHIPHRPLKDPREIRMLDPACGSMHFGLYAFDLFEVIYDEAWEIAQGSDEDRKLSASFAPFLSFVVQYPDKAAFLTDVPRLVIEHNLHGIDIDPRAAQIAGLSLWLRAQRSWQQQGLRPQDRPRIRRSNIVCAEPMPGEEAFLNEFIDTHLSTTPERRLLGQLVRRVFEAMKLAGEAGSLLKIEEEIAGTVAEAKQKWLAGPKPEQFRLFANDIATPVQQELGLDVTGITDEIFWEKAEERIYAALQSYAERAEHDDGYQRRLFADDAARGFAFIDLCRKRYDVVLMNPPFGDAAELSKNYIFAQHSREKTELGACFVTRTLRLLNRGGTVGVISNRTFLFADSFQSWRETCLKNLNLCADLGFGVLDALVETAAFVVVSETTSFSSFIALTNSPNKGCDLLQTVEEMLSAETRCKRLFTRCKSTFEELGTEWFYYWLSEHLLKTALRLSATNSGLLAKPGLQTCDNFRFVRLAWECPQDPLFASTWFRLSKGGEYQPFWADVHLVARWRHDGSEMKAFIERSYDSWSKQIPSIYLYLAPGLTYSERTTSSLSLRVLPTNCLFDKQGPFVGYPNPTGNRENLLLFLGLSYCYLFKALVESQVGLRDATEAGSPARHYMPSMIERLPLPEIAPVEKRKIVTWASNFIEWHRRISSLHPTDSMHGAFPGLSLSGSISAFQNEIGGEFAAEMQSLYSGLAMAEEELARFFEVGPEQEDQLQSIFGPRFADDVNTLSQPEAQEVEKLLNKTEADLVEETVTTVGFFSSILKKSFIASRKVELTALCLNASPVQVLRQAKRYDWLVAKDELSQRLADSWFGTALGRWDIRFATGEKPALELPDPFAPLPVCPPGQLQNEQGLPITREDVGRLKEEGHWNYPIKIPWDGILVDDPGHPLDVEARIQQVLQVIWKDRWESIEREACEILGVRTLRDYFRNFSGGKKASFFADHLKRYSRSRRKAPIYWPLSTDSGNYTLWIYHSRLTDQTLYTCVNDHIDPKLKEIERDIQRLRGAGQPDRKAQKQVDELVELERELKAMREELLRVARLPYKPNQNDGVLVTAAPLWRLFRYKPWQKDLKQCWEELEAGKYNWAHLALAIWPERVREVCKRDKSIAIAHELEDLYEG